MSAKAQNMTVVVTGGSSGIGLGIAQAYAEQGSNVVLSGRSETRLHKAAERIGHPDRVAVLVGDIAQKGTSDRLIALSLERFGRVDVLVNNAGHFVPKAFADYTEEDLDRFLAVHLKGTYFTSQAAVAAMRQQGGGSIVNITTILALRGVAAITASVTAAAKGGVNAITRSLAIELAPDNIRVNAVAPGLIKTPIHQRTEEQFEELNGMQPLGRLGEVKDIVDAVQYLAGATFVTGVVLAVDGGVLAGG